MLLAASPGNHRRRTAVKTRGTNLACPHAIETPISFPEREVHVEKYDERNSLIAYRGVGQGTCLQG